MSPGDMGKLDMREVSTVFHKCEGIRDNIHDHVDFSPRLCPKGELSLQSLQKSIAKGQCGPREHHIVGHVFEKSISVFLPPSFGRLCFGFKHQPMEEVSKWSPQGQYGGLRLLYGVWLGRSCLAPAQSSAPHTTDLLLLPGRISVICCWTTLPSRPTSSIPCFAPVTLQCSQPSFPEIRGQLL